jgi:diguanylate cyclase (GGDEF)-like protein
LSIIGKYLATLKPTRENQYQRGVFMQKNSINRSQTPGFIQEFNARHRMLSRIIYCVLFFAVLIFSVWDAFIIGFDHPRLQDFVIDRALISFPFVVAGFLLTFSTSSKVRLDWWMTACFMAVGLGTVHIYGLFGQIQVAVSLEGLMLFMLTVYIVPTIFARQKVLVGMVIFLAYLVLVTITEQGAVELMQAVIYLGLINLGGAIHSFSFDQQLRDNYKNNKILEKIAHTDHLTGAHNRHRFEADFNQILALAKEENAFVGLYIVDIDQFKQYNDHYGHLQGDECLVAIAQTLLSLCTHEKDRCIRFGGEEFILVKYADSLTVLEQWGMALLDAVRKLNMKHEYSTVAEHVTVTIGAAFIKADDRETRASLMARADAALYQAKKAGRDRLLLAD